MIIAEFDNYFNNFEWTVFKRPEKPTHFLSNTPSSTCFKFDLYPRLNISVKFHLTWLYYYNQACMFKESIN